MVLKRPLAVLLCCALAAFGAGARAQNYYDMPDEDVQVPDVPVGPKQQKSGKPLDAAAILDLAEEDPAAASDGSDQDNYTHDDKQLELLATRPYAVEADPGFDVAMKAPSLPDLTKYTPEAAMAKMSRKPAGRASVESMLDKMSFKGFMSGKHEGLREWAMRQTSLPKIIYIRDGYVNLADLARQLPAEYFQQVGKGVYVARLPIDVTPGATLHVDGDLRLSLDRGAFLVNEGKLFVSNAKLRAWNEDANKPATFRGEKSFRPFLISWAGSQTYIVNSVVAHLGYSASKAYGVSISQFSPGLKPKMNRPNPTGWILNSEFYDNWYGFYCYEADDIVVKGNNYHDNIVYGIDPHDRSHRLIIADNKASKTKKKHGIIISREVNDSWIIGNEAFDNALSGIVLDRNSSNTIVAFNKIYRNGADGLTVYESPRNLIWENLASGNKRHGFRVRNSTDMRLYGNVAVANGLAGIYGHIKDVGAGRNVRLDPFEERVSMTVVGGQLVSNGSSPISVDAPLSLELYNVDLRAPQRQLGIKFTGVLGKYQEKVLDILMRQKAAVIVKPAGQTAVSKK